MSEMPEDIRAIAASLATEVAAAGTFIGLQRLVADVLLAERKAATEAERERCVQIASTTFERGAPAAAALVVAAAILRSPDKPEEAP